MSGYNFAARGAEPIVIATQPKPRTSWWTVAEAGEAFTRELREAQARMACDPHIKCPTCRTSRTREVGDDPAHP